MKRSQNSATCRKKAKKVFNRFMAFLANQNKLIMAEDMIQSNSFTYTYIDRLNISKCVLQRRLDIAGPKFNLRLSIEIRFFGGTAGCFDFILYHRNGERLDKPDSWVWSR